MGHSDTNLLPNIICSTKELFRPQRGLFRAQHHYPRPAAVAPFCRRCAAETVRHETNRWNQNRLLVGSSLTP